MDDVEREPHDLEMLTMISIVCLVEPETRGVAMMRLLISRGAEVDRRGNPEHAADRVTRGVLYSLALRSWKPSFGQAPT